MEWWWYELVIVILGLILLFYIWATWHYDTFKKQGVPFLKPVPFFGTSGLFWLGRMSFGDMSLRTYRAFEGKSIVGYFDFRDPTIMIRDPEVLKMITTKDFEHFTDHRPFFEEENNPLFAKTVFSLRGSRWKRMRNILTPAFTSSKMKSMFTLVADCGIQLGDFLEERYKAEGVKSLTLDMMDLFTKYAMDVIATSAFGIHCDSLRKPDNEFYVIGKQAVDFGGLNMIRVLVNSMTPGLAKLLNYSVTPPRVNNFFQSLIRDTMRTRERKGIVRPDLIHLLMQAKKGTLTGDDDVTGKSPAKKGVGADLSDEDVTAQAFVFFLAGFDTSSTLDCFLAHLLAEHPDVQRRVQEEIDDVLREDGGKLTYDGVVHRMKYLDMVISETMRLWPPVLETDRICVKTYTIPATASMPAVVIKEGQAINIPIVALHRDAKYFPDPERFDPERFSDVNKHNINPFVYMPFGTGPRACIGLRFALMATKIMIVNLLTRFDLEISAKTMIPMKFEKNTFNTSIEGGFWLAIKPRISQT